MKKILFIISSLTLLSMVLSACAGQATQAPAGEPPVVEVATTEAVVPPVEGVPVDLGGLLPPMEIGSTFRYVDGTLLVAVPGGPSPQGAKHIPDNPEAVWKISDFWAYATEVTNRQFAFCVFTKQCATPDLNDNKVYNDPLHANDPVVGVNYDQAAQYCGWVHGRLPTSHEWEYLARGEKGFTYPWGETAPSCGLLNTADCVGKPTMVLTYDDGRSPFLAWDMGGNVYEWVADWYSSKLSENLLGPEFGDKRVVRSSSFGRSFFEAEAARIWSLKPNEHKNDLGFRCVVEDPLFFAPFCEAKVIYGMDANGNPIPGGGSPPSCNADVIPTNHYCNMETGDLWAQLTVNPPGATVDNAPAGCNEGPPGVWTCCQGTCAANPGGSWDGTSLDVHVDCPAVLPGDYACPPGYDASGDGCSAQGHPGECLAGTNYDPVNQCCSALDANGVSFGCPVGWFDTPTGCSPIPQPPGFDPASGVPPFLPVDCTPGGDNDGDSDGDGDTACPPQDPYCNPTGGG